jgi:pre-mRNA-splicing factor 18
MFMGPAVVSVDLFNCAKMRVKSGRHSTAMLRGDYLSAGDAYIRLSIGKAAWTLGVSQVGIHERIARERIYVGKLPHVLNDEVQRKYVTGIKRLMTFMQHTWPPADPSRAVTN